MRRKYSDGGNLGEGQLPPPAVTPLYKSPGRKRIYCAFQGRKSHLVVTPLVSLMECLLVPDDGGGFDQTHQTRVTLATVCNRATFMHNLLVARNPVCRVHNRTRIAGPESEPSNNRGPWTHALCMPRVICMTGLVQRPTDD